MGQLKLAFSGKGGVGKTTMTAIFSHLLKERGHRVLAVDADPDANLGMALGFSQKMLEDVKTISEDRDLIKKKTGAEPGITGSWFSLNPKVDDIPSQYIVEREGIQLLQMGSTKQGGSGCACPESTLLKTLLNHLVTEKDDVLVIDFEAGLEHLGRSTAASVDALIIVTEPGVRSFETAKSVKKLAKDIGVNRCFIIKNKWIDHSSITLDSYFEDEEIIGTVPYEPLFVTADQTGISLYEQLDGEIKSIFNNMLDQLFENLEKEKEEV